ncbi:MAG TPA: PEGA domain-containing protein, partial [Pyrinomonadaceae bacterium]|nr:PEGA domain-containing protein [Pyrinomonadaceae bacterium]
ITAYIAGDTPLDPAKFNKQSSAAVESGTPRPEASATAMSPVVIKSTPDGAEITIDGKLVGTTPSTVQLTTGEHTIAIDKSGFKQWQRTITVTAGGAINLEASLDKLR